MSRTRKDSADSVSKRKSRPALTPDAREKQMISLAVDQAEKQLKEGTASSQVLTYYLKLGSPREKLERERLEEENRLLKAKIEALKSSERMEELYLEAIESMKEYSGRE